MTLPSPEKGASIDTLSELLDAATFHPPSPTRCSTSTPSASASLGSEVEGIYAEYPLNNNDKDDLLEQHVMSYETLLKQSQMEIDALRLENKKLKKALLAQKNQIHDLKQSNHVLATNLTSLFQTATLEIARLKK